ncbi:hypothetical protein SA496_19585 [Pseudomonas sp. JS3066]|jgi:hypothetical protein|uniref:hypothetical protein n=1 Tax=unclassified Pseudomonas TaxID=196821 RepID=UPI000EAA1CB0|nr:MULTISPECIES: hypothetical protein [unclassified Pseudomonas]AYF90496.1 hypothetical protein D6Z43_26410 [Pseudomonas sp. DY-1]MDH4651661.1 hypothetical protein [Pseudomonas sp. BN606]MRK22901.1 hypothetical protein [Pseudomonas sp. JG-B]WVK91906.1 hypothetical protein SA496_19585 [Pseudomonas sp. JS3066]
MPQQDSLIGPVPVRIIEVARSTLTPFEGRVADFNVAAWLHLPGMTDLPVSLLVSYMDGGQRREVAVDHGRLNTKGKILLAGIARVPFKQKIELMQVRLRSAVPIKGLLVEELFVQAVELAEPAKSQARA